MLIQAVGWSADVQSNRSKLFYIAIRVVSAKVKLVREGDPII